MEIKINLTDKQAAALQDVIKSVQPTMPPEEFARRATIAAIIQNKQRQIAEELGRE